MSSRVKGVKGAKSIQSIVINSLKVAARSAGFSALLLISGSLTAVHAQQDGITLNGTLTQGSLIRGQVAPDAIVTLDGETLALNSEGKFVFGFPRDASLSHTLNVELPDGTTLVRDITLTKREYNIQRIDGLDSKMVTPPKAVLERIRQDNVNVSIARSKVTDADALFTRFEWPAKGPITGVYGSQRVLNGVPKWPHFGVDVGGPTGAPVTAPVEGTVTLAEDLYLSLIHISEPTRPY